MKKLWILSFSLHLSRHTTMQNRISALLYLLIFRFTCMLLFFTTVFERLILFIYFWSHSVACGILVPRPGIEHRPPALGVQSLNHRTTKEVPNQDILRLKRDIITNLAKMMNGNGYCPGQSRSVVILFLVVFICFPWHLVFIPRTMRTWTLLTEFEKFALSHSMGRHL